MDIKEKLTNDAKALVEEYQALLVIASKHFNSSKWKDLTEASIRLTEIQLVHRYVTGLNEGLTESDPK